MVIGKFVFDGVVKVMVDGVFIGIGECYKDGYLKLKCGLLN